MSKKQMIIKYTTALLQSALARGSNQGIVVYNTVLDKLNSSIPENDIDVLLEKLNNALAGIEAHGDLTTDEFHYIEELRKLSP